MTSSTRREDLLSILKETSYCDVNALSSELGVSRSTVRRDLQVLSQEGLVIRTHGGALIANNHLSIIDQSFDQKKRVMVKEKQAIGLVASELVNPGETIILDSGTTTLQIAQYLGSKRPLTVVSTDLQILLDLAKLNGINVIDTGGILKPHLNVLIGPQTLRFLNNLSVNWIFLGVDAIDISSGITVTNIEEMAVKQAMIKAGNRVVVVADNSKFNKVAFAKVCDLSDIHILITDQGIPLDLANEIHDLGIDLQIVDLPA